MTTINTTDLDLSFSHYPTHDTVSGLVTDGDTGFNWYETVKMSGYYCDEEDCPDDGECSSHPAGYWVQVMRDVWFDNITSRGMVPVIGDDK
jgi:hypothetical protein